MVPPELGVWSISNLLMGFGTIISVSGATLIVLGVWTKIRPQTLFQNRRLILNPTEPVSRAPDGSINYLRYLNVMLPISHDVELSAKIILVKGDLKFRIVGYFGNPAELGQGRWVSNIFYPNEGESLHVNIIDNYELPSLRLLKRDYVCEFAVMDASNAKPFEVRFTAITKRREPWLRGAEGLKDLGRLLVAVGVPLIVVGIANLLRASG